MNKITNGRFGRFLAILIHFFGAAVAIAIAFGLTQMMAGTIPDEMLTGTAILSCVALAWVTVRVVRGRDTLTTKAADFVNGK